jgi:hypothetical protein
LPFDLVLYLPPPDEEYGGVPPVILRLRMLRTLSLRHQSLRFVPAQLGLLRHLEKLLLDCNPLLERIDAGVGRAPLFSKSGRQGGGQGTALQ